VGVRILLLADTHLGFDMPRRPRVERARRGAGFFANYARALAPALSGSVDLVVHGGDLLYRSRVDPGLVLMAFEPLLHIAECGVPIAIVPGNHERSAIPHPLLVRHPNIHVFLRPATYCLEIAGLRVSLSGFPFQRDHVRDAFPRNLDDTRWRDAEADVRLLCMHQAVEGAVVGAQEFMFRDGPDVVRGCDLLRGFAAVLSGHIHRRQTLRRGPGGGAFPVPVVYPGSTERTSWAERFEQKGFLLLEAEATDHGGRITRCKFTPLPSSLEASDGEGVGCPLA
jgi:DNA repair protein SbcD/Mre11